ncbi:hypothetical protein BS50DRAFT_379152 [Corynespora cassiicola Philippines]|uniref:Uncharacterized protein n=1 Tax=Corynespora cassiicola Philippines TaxID=1448308 RepID=A0A2T2NNF3_CORCC|nr:hypothetical protein BS50DRAFT_379152 [Corynespora cassiicola Philippines]
MLAPEFVICASRVRNGVRNGVYLFGVLCKDVCFPYPSVIIYAFPSVTVPSIIEMSSSPYKALLLYGSFRIQTSAPQDMVLWSLLILHREWLQERLIDRHEFSLVVKMFTLRGTRLYSFSELELMFSLETSLMSLRLLIDQYCLTWLRECLHIARMSFQSILTAMGKHHFNR